MSTPAAVTTSVTVDLGQTTIVHIDLTLGTVDFALQKPGELDFSDPDQSGEMAAL